MIHNYNNTPIYYEIQGKGPALVFLHGFLESSTMWEPLLPYLIKNHAVLTIDLPGHGRSGCISEIHTMDLMAQVVNDLVVSLDIDSFSLIGHSMGGYVSLAYIETFEETVDKIVLLNSTSAADSTERKQNRDRAIKVFENSEKLFIAMAINSLFIEETHLKYAPEIQRMKVEASQFPPEGITAAIKGMKSRPDRTSVLNKFKREKIIISGKEDPIVPFDEVNRISKDSSTKFLKVNGGHMTMIENFSEIVKLFT